ncbi:hypothetical protein N602_32145 [Mycobacterium avium subsp. hominissuis 10-5606]|nr:hypothetical protein N602_32145 [Mycobacterium avium subsp. hominissuis 10-5606]
MVPCSAGVDSRNDVGIVHADDRHVIPAQLR